MTPKRSLYVLPFLPGVREFLPSFGEPSLVLVRKTPKAGLRESFTQGYLQTHHPKESWTHVYTDGSAENAVRNGGVGFYIQYPEGKEDKISLANGLCSTNYKAEAEALKTAAAHTEVSTHASPNVVLSQMPCQSCRLHSQIGTLNTTTCLPLLPPFAETMQSPCNGFPPTASSHCHNSNYVPFKLIHNFVR